MNYTNLLGNPRSYLGIKCAWFLSSPGSHLEDLQVLETAGRLAKVAQVGISGSGLCGALVPFTHNRLFFLGLGLPDLKMPGVPLSQ